MKKVVLFDMDGTLTEPRQKIEINMEQSLKELQEAGYEIGILTGSDMDYVKQQCCGLFDLSLVDASKIHFLPCNGTKYILNGETIYERNMRDYMGENRWDTLMRLLVMSQHHLLCNHSYHFPITGHFFNYRGSMLNWCPIGRNATHSDRETWESVDKEHKIRELMLEDLKKHISILINFTGDLPASDIEIVVKYGGDTSFDIFPKGWDKTYVLEKTDIFSDYDEIHFIGDRCEPNGNDYEIYMHPKTIAQQTKNVEDTIRRVHRIIHDYV